MLVPAWCAERLSRRKGGVVGGYGDMERAAVRLKKKSATPSRE